MNIAVCLKQIPDTEARLKIKDGAVDLTDVKLERNPFDEFAVEEAIRMKEQGKASKVTILSLGDEKVAEVIKWAFSIGADEGIHLIDTAFHGLDVLSNAKVIAAALKKGEYGLILFGKQAVDDDSMLTAQAVAEILDLPHVGVVTKIEINDDGYATCHREVEGGVEIFETPLPAVVSAEKGLNEVRYASLKGIMSAKRKKITKLAAADLDIDTAVLSPENNKISILSLEPPPVRAAGKIVEGESPEEKVDKLIDLLKNEAKVI